MMEVNRHACYGMIHDGIKQLLIERFGHFSEQEYHQLLSSISGRDSCVLMSDEELAHTVAHLKDEGYLSDTSLL